MRQRPILSVGRERDPRLSGFRRRTREHGVNPLLYWAARLVLVPFFRVYFRLEGIGSEHLSRSGPLLLASNHRSFLDPFVIGAIVRRPVYYVAKRELFERRWQAPDSFRLRLCTWRNSMPALTFSTS